MKPKSEIETVMNRNCVITLSNDVNTGIVSEGFEGEEGAETLVERDLARVIAEVSLEGLVGFSAGLGNGNVFKGHCCECVCCGEGGKRVE